MTATTYAAPRSLAEALAALAAVPGSVPVAGGTDLVVGVRQGRRGFPPGLVAIHAVEELKGIAAAADGGLRLGALATHAAVAADPYVRASFAALADASALVGSPATRGSGTVGGNVANASPAMELGAPLLVLGGSVELAGPGGSTRTVALADFLLGPGRTAAAPGELLTGVVVPAPAPGRSGSAYVRLQYRRAMEIAVVGAAAFVVLDAEGRVAQARVALTAVAPTVLEAPAVGAALIGREPTADALAGAAALAAGAAAPIDDVRASAAYRLAQLPVAARRALEAAVARAQGGHAAVPVPATARWSP